MQYGLKFDLRSTNNIQPRDLLQHEDIKELFVKFFDRIDKHVKKTKD